MCSWSIFSMMWCKTISYKYQQWNMKKKAYIYSAYCGILWMQKWKSPVLRYNWQLSKVLSFKPGVGQNTALHALPAARISDFVFSIFLVHSTSLSPSSLWIYNDVCFELWISVTCDLMTSLVIGPHMTIKVDLVLNIK